MGGLVEPCVKVRVGTGQEGSWEHWGHTWSSVSCGWSLRFTWDIRTEKLWMWTMLRAKVQLEKNMPLGISRPQVRTHAWDGR